MLLGTWSTETVSEVDAFAIERLAEQFPAAFGNVVDVRTFPFRGRRVKASAALFWRSVSPLALRLSGDGVRIRARVEWWRPRRFPARSSPRTSRGTGG